MNILRITRLILAATGCVVAGTLTAAPLNRADLPANPAWVFHLDCDGLRPTTIGQYILGEMDKPESKQKLAIFQTMFGFDLGKELRGVTLFSTGTKTEDGILIVYANFDSNRLVTLARGAKEYDSEDYHKHPIHSWADEKRQAKDIDDARIYAAIQGKRVIFGQRKETVKAELDVLDGGANLSKSGEFPELGKTDSTSFIQGASSKLNLPGKDPNAAIFRMSKSISLDVTEEDKNLRASLKLTAADEDTARNIASIGQGLLALLRLQKENPMSAKLVDSLTLTQEGATASCTLKVPAADIVELARADAAKKALKKSE